MVDCSLLWPDTTGKMKRIFKMATATIRQFQCLSDFQGYYVWIREKSQASCPQSDAPTFLPKRRNGVQPSLSAGLGPNRRAATTWTSCHPLRPPGTHTLVPGVHVHSPGDSHQAKERQCPIKCSRLHKEAGVFKEAERCPRSRNTLGVIRTASLILNIIYLSINN